MDRQQQARLQTPPAGPVNYAATARRRPWNALPDAVREYVAGVLGAPVDKADPAGGGFTHGFAAMVSGGGCQLFAKAAPSSDDLIFPAYVREAEVLAALPSGIPVPRLLAAGTVTVGQEKWQVLCFEAVIGRMPGDPWTTEDLEASHESLVAIQNALLELPPGIAGGHMGPAFAEAPFSQLFGEITAGESWPSFIPRLDKGQLGELQQLCDHSRSALAGEAVLHNDLRADNLIIRNSDGKAFLCDWNFLSTGPPWVDWVALLPYTRPHGVDADSWLARSPLSASAADGDIDSWLAILGAYMIFHGSKPDVPSSPLLRSHGRYTARLIIEWLADRRGWNR